MTLNLARLRCPMCGSRVLSDIRRLDSEDARHERVEVTCRQKHVVRLTVRRIDGEDGEAEGESKR